MTAVDNEIKTAMRQFIADRGRPVEFRDLDWDDKPTVSPYGWVDYDVAEHTGKGQFGGGCAWVVPEGTIVEEITYSMFDNTFTGNKDEVGLNAPGCHCKCGKYKDLTLRVTSSLGDAIQALLGYDPSKRLEL